MLKLIKSIIYEKISSPGLIEYIKIELLDEENILEFVDNMYPSSFNKPICVTVSDELLNDFIDKLLRTTAEWNTEYYQRNIIDGTEWKLKILLKNNTEKCYAGRNDFPSNFEYLDRLKYELLKNSMTN